MVAVVFAVRPGCPRRLLRRDHPEVGKAVVRLGGVAIHDGLLAHGRLSAWGRERAPTISSIRLTETTSGSVSGSVIP
jgi:hypothetical protein